MWCRGSTLDSVDALLAIVRSGAILVPLNPAASPAEMAHVVEDAEPVVIVTDQSDVAAAFGSSVITLSVDDLSGLSATGAPFAQPALGPDDDALIVYTSGTTGQPKGAVHTHASVLAGIAALQARGAGDPRIGCS